MINLLLNAVIAKKKSEHKIKAKIVLVIVSFIFISIFTIIYIYDRSKLSGIGMIISFFFLYIVMFLLEKEKLKQYQDEYDEYNKILDNLRIILKGFTYKDNNNNDANWYSQEKIKYLISACEKRIDEYQKSNATFSNLGKTIIFPIVAFVSGIIADNASINEVLALGIFALVFVPNTSIYYYRKTK